MGDECRKLKVLFSGETRHGIPPEFTEVCNFEQFVNRSEGRLPLILKTDQGMEPKLTAGLKNYMEGQKVVFLKISGENEEEKSFEIREIRSGRFITLNEIK